MRVFLYTVVDGDYYNPPFIAGGDNEAKHAVKACCKAQKLTKSHVSGAELQIIGTYDNETGTLENIDNQTVCLISDLCEEV